MSKEIKMSNVFALPVYRGVQEVNIRNKEKPCIVSGTSTTVIARPKYIEATIHAINNHDRLVEENKRLRELLAGVVSEYELLLGKSIQHVGSHGTSALGRASKLLSELGGE